MDQIVQFFEDDSSNDDSQILLVPPPVLVDDDNDIDVMHLLDPFLEAARRYSHVKITNYVENVVVNYIEDDFVMHFRLSRQVTYDLINRFEASSIFLSLQDSEGGFATLSAEKHLLTFLWFVGHESAGYRDVADRFGISISTLFNLITRVAEFVLSISSSIIRFPTLEERNCTKDHYQRERGFPGVIGSMDGSHIRIDKPLVDKDSYINRKQFYSIQLQGVVDHQLKFIDIFVGYPGSVHDARVFRESPLFNDLGELCGDGNYLLGDSAYPCLNNLMVPYRDNGHLTRAQIRFNVRLSSCRVSVENAFGNLKQRFRQLYHIKLRNMSRLIHVIHACCVLHNLANADDLTLFEPPLEETDGPENSTIQGGNRDELLQDHQTGRELRDEICRQIATRR